MKYILLILILLSIYGCRDTNCNNCKYWIPIWQSRIMTYSRLLYTNDKEYHDRILEKINEYQERIDQCNMDCK